VREKITNSQRSMTKTSINFLKKLLTSIGHHISKIINKIRTAALILRRKNKKI
jgi:hypothetical protein